MNRDRTFQEMYESTLTKENILRREGYTLVVIWECQWDRKVKHDPTLQSFLSSLHLVEPLGPRDAFFGGRTNATTLYYKADATIGEEIRYVDVTSLYPFINATGEYPVGHPDIITRPPTTDISRFFGVAKVDILPPFNLFHPVLPHRQGGKLTFPICRSCIESEMSKPLTNKSCVCRH